MSKFKNVYLIFTVLASLLSADLIAQSAESHKILNEDLKKSSFKKLIKSASKADVIFFGEMHDDPISHWLELKVVKELEKMGDVAIGMEMFELDNQEALEQFVTDEIDLETFEKEARLWDNYKTDYAPVVDFAKSKNIKVFATNIPRRYASMVYKGGFESVEGLVEEEMAYIAPMPIEYDPELPGYQKMLKMIEGHGGDNFPKAQAIKDATMAYSISQAYSPDVKFIHLNGKYHSDNKEGILWYLEKYSPGLKVLTITTVREGEEIMKGTADFVITIDEDMISTY